MIKVSFDYDSTLSRSDVEKYAKDLINRNIEVWICTSRYSPSNAPRKDWNDDLFLVADRVGIKREHIIFTNFENKSEHLNNKGFKWHIDDDSIELSFIKTDTDLKPIFLYGNKKWQSDCENALK